MKQLYKVTDKKGTLLFCDDDLGLCEAFAGAYKIHKGEATTISKYKPNYNIIKWAENGTAGILDRKTRAIIGTLTKLDNHTWAVYKHELGGSKCLGQFNHYRTALDIAKCI